MHALHFCFLFFFAELILFWDEGVGSKEGCVGFPSLGFWGGGPGGRVNTWTGVLGFRECWGVWGGLFGGVVKRHCQEERDKADTSGGVTGYYDIRFFRRFCRG